MSRQPADPTAAASAEPSVQADSGSEATDASDLTFEESLENLDQIVRQLEAGEMELSDALKHYEAGVGFLRQCHDALEDAERKIELLQGVRQGKAEFREFDDQELSMEEKQLTRSQRRS